ncbi:N(4)-acetylcytidine aminohydrolase [Enterobacter sp. R1(2018)]|uniref:N(4)-acetylcytidine aminohydrolase n=1 Tax=Enterobacter sp. R1(2018) TaxID=2447891 RepID=UPI000EB0CFC0|nr:N(4)-acetylcytidine aminohydrolase [Enterobacter sp. R1(2018)]RKQ39539.1 ASCH domain-containing protein [Enterobacter sp. R1(2018)]
MNDITFFQRFEADIVAGRKTITLRDEAESHFHPGQLLRVGRYEDDVWFCNIKVTGVSPVLLNELTEEHARQENMTLPQLKEVIGEIYPGLNELYVISFERVATQ